MNKHNTQYRQRETKHIDNTNILLLWSICCMAFFGYLTTLSAETLEDFKEDVLDVMPCESCKVIFEDISPEDKKRLQNLLDSME